MSLIRLTDAARLRRAHEERRRENAWSTLLRRVLRPRFVERRARAVGSPRWACTRCGGLQASARRWSPRFCEHGCDDAELERFQVEAARYTVVH